MLGVDGIVDIAGLEKRNITERTETLNTCIYSRQYLLYILLMLVGSV
jgi:hypothetical protein